MKLGAGPTRVVAMVMVASSSHGGSAPGLAEPGPDGPAAPRRAGAPEPNPVPGLGFGLFPRGPVYSALAAVRPTGHETPVPPSPQYPFGFFARYCWW